MIPRDKIIEIRTLLAKEFDGLFDTPFIDIKDKETVLELCEKCCSVRELLLIIVSKYKACEKSLTIIFDHIEVKKDSDYLIKLILGLKRHEICNDIILLKVSSRLYSEKKYEKALELMDNFTTDSEMLHELRARITDAALEVPYGIISKAKSSTDYLLQLSFNGMICISRNQ